MNAADGKPIRRKRQADQPAGQAGVRAGGGRRYAVSQRDSGGRRTREPDHPYRNCFQRDRDRVIHCSAFRRLDFKTQVFVPHEQDHFRTRLTHTIEVAQIARDIARALDLNEDLAEVVALAHDLGHPPFGHAGEKALDDIMADHGRFEHNRQSLRVVDYLEHPYPDFRGLNLTNVVRECLAKHQTKYDSPLGDEFPVGEAAPLAGQVVDLADEIAWTSADLDDALVSGRLTMDHLTRSALWLRALRQAERDYPHAGARHRRIRATKAVLAILADEVIAASRIAIEQAGVDSPDEVRRLGRRLIVLPPATRRHADELQELLLHEVYLAGETAGHAEEAEKIIRQLFEAYLHDPSLLPDHYARRIGRREGETLHRVICDYIAGMTDRFCRREHDRLLGRLEHFS